MEYIDQKESWPESGITWQTRPQGETHLLAELSLGNLVLSPVNVLSRLQQHISNGTDPNFFTITLRFDPAKENVDAFFYSSGDPSGNSPILKVTLVNKTSSIDNSTENGCDCDLNPPQSNGIVRFDGRSPSHRFIPKDACGRSLDGQAELFFKFSTIEEFTPQGEILSVLDFALQSFFMNTTAIASNGVDVGSRIFFPNQPKISFSFTLYDSPQTLSFNGIQFDVDRNTLKWSIKIEEWDFIDPLHNSLQINIQLSGIPTIQSIIKIDDDNEDGNVNNNNISSYRFLSSSFEAVLNLLEVVRVDDSLMKTEHSFSENFDLLTIRFVRDNYTDNDDDGDVNDDKLLSPVFVYDPDLSFTLFGGQSKDECGDEDEDFVLILAIVLPTVVVLFILVVVVIVGSTMAIVAFRNRKRNRMNAINIDNYSDNDDSL